MPEPGTVLLAEDNADDVLLIQIAYANAGIRQRLQVVSDGQEVIGYLSGEGAYADRAAYPFPTLLLLDLKMPETDGFDVLNWLRQHPEVAGRLTTVILTGTSSPHALARARELGAQSVLVKSVAFAELENSMVQIKNTWLDSAAPT